MKTLFKAGCIAGGLLAVAALPASAASGVASQDRAQVGRLECQMAPNVAFVIGSERDLSCTFLSNARGAKPQTYQGEMRRFGLDIGFNGKGKLVWNVLAPSSVMKNDSLRGTYVGASSNASLGNGVGANVLLGGSNNTISLQPLSIQKQTGVNLGLGVSSLSLR
ncbi:DUF992 domain-containing protein [Xanthobacter sp. TB0139]|uniref:DUF992 domain-containing protein n=1 Tax=Xanthobacter sp. TB0139 TaxID=3459178 RepID=UPI0040391EC5